MEHVIDTSQLAPVAREHSDNIHIVRRDSLKIGLISVRPHDELPIHSHDHEDQFYYVLEGEGIVHWGGQDYPVKPGVAVMIPQGVAHGVRNPNDAPLRYLDVYIDWMK